MTDRQRITVGVHVSEKHGSFKPQLWPADADQPIASLEIIDGLRIQAEDPQIFRTLADFCIRAANTVEAALVEQARREAAADMAMDAHAEADAEARALGFHDAECRAELEMDALAEELAR